MIVKCKVNKKFGRCDRNREINAEWRAESRGVGSGELRAETEEAEGWKAER